MLKRYKKENKAKLEHKLYLARETPEPVFDLSECDLTTVPSGIYSLCKVFLKEKLELQQNCLTNLYGGGNLKDLCLLKILNIGHNALTSLPVEIDQLINLQELYVNDNRLKQLPTTLCQLKSLQILDISTNNIKTLPENLGEMTNLQEINLQNNKYLKTLPKSISLLQCNLQNIKIDIDNFIYPPKEVATNGTVAIIKFICEDIGIPYTGQTETSKLERTGSSKSFTKSPSNSTKANIMDYENNKRKKMLEFLEIERQRNILQRQEYDLAQSVKIDREKLLCHIAEQQSQFDYKLIKLQQEREKDRFRLIEQLQGVENNANNAVNQLLSRNQEPLLKLLEQEKLEEERLLEVSGKQYDNLDKNKILAEMQEILSQESETFKKYGEFRTQFVKTALTGEIESDKHFAEILSDLDLQKVELVSKLEEDMLLQKAAVGTLLERSDARSWALIQEMRLVETQLAALTVLELDKRRLKMDEHLTNLAEKRENLSYLLMKLYEEQNQRRSELLSTLKHAEEYSDQSADFWLQQYQRLLERMPTNLMQNKNINQELAQRLLLAGVIHYLPVLMKLLQDEDDLENLNEKDIADCGVTNTEDCYKIYKEIKLHVQEKDVCKEPSAPPAEEEAAAPSAPPPLNTFHSNGLTECVICMELECQAIFIPCGHYCCCFNCSSVISVCPLCRSNINQKIKVFN